MSSNINSHSAFQVSIFDEYLRVLHTCNCQGHGLSLAAVEGDSSVDELDSLASDVRSPIHALCCHLWETRSPRVIYEGFFKVIVQYLYSIYVVPTSSQMIPISTAITADLYSLTGGARLRSRLYPLIYYSR